MADGNLNIRHRTVTMQQAAGESKRRQKLYGNTHKFFVRGRAHKPAKDDFVFAQTRREKLQPYERLLRSFRYQRALTAALEVRVLCGVGICVYVACSSYTRTIAVVHRLTVVHLSDAQPCCHCQHGA